MDWRKSSFSSANGGACVEVASGDEIYVRDTTNRNGGAVSFTADAWGAFVTGIKHS